MSDETPTRARRDSQGWSGAKKGLVTAISGFVAMLTLVIPTAFNSCEAHRMATTTDVEMDATYKETRKQLEKIKRDLDDCLDAAAEARAAAGLPAKPEAVPLPPLPPTPAAAAAAQEATP